ncbi:MAG: hypothetical protein WAV06_01385, partial [Terracidiphilus sp.]
AVISDRARQLPFADMGIRLLRFIAYATVARIDRMLDERVSLQYFWVSDWGEEKSSHGQVGR